MKIKHLFLLTLMSVSLALGFSSCSDDDEDIIDQNELLVTKLSFKDTNLTAGKIAGEATWTKPARYSDLTKLVLYSSSNGTSKDTKLSEVTADTESFTIESQNHFQYLIVASVNKEGKEEDVFASVKIEDYIAGGIYILNSGSYKGNNANLAYYDFASGTFLEKIFEASNKKSLGDTGQDMIIYGSKMYIAMYGSGIIYVTDTDGKILKEIESSTTEGGTTVKQQPRKFATHGGKVYVTYYNGYLAKIDTTEMKIQEQIKVGSNPEYVRATNNKLYVANSAGMSGSYGTTVSIVDIPSFKEDKKLTVKVENPEKLEVDSKGYIYLISNGDYGDVKNTLQRIDPKTEKVDIIGNATYMTILGNKLHTIYSQWGDTNITFKTYNTDNMAAAPVDFITDGTKIASPYSISSDPVNNYVYISESDFKTDGDMYIFTEGGKLIKKFDTKGINPMGAWFISAD